MRKFAYAIAAILSIIMLTQRASAECSGVPIAPSDAANLAVLIQAQPTGTTFCFQPGVYAVTATVESRSGDNLVCTLPRACILDGGNTVAVGFRTEYQATAQQVISGFEVRQFSSYCLFVRPLGRVENNDAHDCMEGAQMNGVAVGNHIHHNMRYGLSGGPAIGILIEGNEIDDNNTSHFDLGDAGGSKIVGSQAGGTVTWRGNRVHDNFGVGIWQDGNVTTTLIEGNEVYNNTESGILHEISWAATIRHNYVHDNNLSHKNLGQSCWHGAQIEVGNSQGVNIYGNLVIADGVNGICLTDTRRSETAPFPTALANVVVSSNTIKMNGNVRSGFVWDAAPVGTRFSSNAYYVTNLSGVYWQYQIDKTKGQWQAAGQDTLGSFAQW